MQVHFRNTPEEVAALASAFPWWLRLWWAMKWMVVLAACCVPGTLLLALLGMWSGALASWGAYLLLCGSLFLWSRLASSQPRQAMNTRWLTPTTVRVTDDMLVVDSELSCSRRVWSAIDRVRTTRTHIVIFVNRISAFSVPIRAFESSEQAEDFERLVRARVGTGEPNERLADGLLDIPSGIEVSYQNTGDDFATVQYDGLRADGKPPNEASSLMGGFVMGCIGLLLAISTRETGGSIESVAGIGVTILVGILPAVLWHNMERRYAARRVETVRLLPQTLTISPEGIGSRDDLRIAFNKWSGLEVDHDDRYIVFYYPKPNIGFVVPKAAFATPDEAQRVVEFASEAIDRATQQQPLEKPPKDDQHNPYQAPSS